MNTQSVKPTLQEMELVIARGERCLKCKATPTSSESPCYEFTPGGVEVCSELPWWNGKPVLPETLREWKEILSSYQAVPHRPDD
jgi:hypothetical protein